MNPRADGSAPVMSMVPLRGRSPWSILPPLIVGFFMIMVDTTIVNIAIPTLVRDFRAPLDVIGWVNSAYMLAYAALMLLAGRLGDRYGPRRVFIAGLILFTGASALCGLSNSIGLLIGARALQGVGAALMAPQTMTLITRVFPPAHRGAAMGLWGATAGVATMLGPVLGGIFLETVGWEWIFFINVPLGVIALWFSFSKLPELASQTSSIDAVSAMLSLGGLSLLIFGIQEGESFDWANVVGFVDIRWIMALAITLIAAFLWRQRKLKSQALLPLRLFQNRNFSWANVAGMSINFAMVAVFFPLTVFLQSVIGMEPLAAALVVLPSSVISGVVSPMAGRLSDSIPGKWVLATGFMIMTLALAWLFFVVSPEASAWQVAVPMTLFGLGSGSVLSPLANVATSGLDAQTAGAGSGVFNATRQLGSVLGSALAVTLLNARLSVEISNAAKRIGASLSPRLHHQLTEVLSNVDSREITIGTAPDRLAGPAGISTEATDLINGAVSEAISAGFASSVAQTLLLAAGVSLLGVCASLAMSGKKSRTFQPE